MNLLIDIGNTQVKLALAEEEIITRLSSLQQATREDIAKVLEANPAVNNCIVVKSGAYPEGWEKELKDRFPSFIELLNTTAIPLEIVYKSKESLGMDRIASAVGANALFPKKDILVIDAGTAITADLVSSDEKYLGGNIIPGMSIRFKALHDYTERLPLLMAVDDFPLLGDSTETAIQAGVINGIIFEVEGYIRALKNKYPQLTVVLTGGDAEFFAKHLKNNIFVELNLIFAGLNRIIEYNADKGQNFSH